MAKGLDSGRAYEILSIDIADIDVGKNIGAELQIDQANADKGVAQAHAEQRRAMAIALEQEMRAKGRRSVCPQMSFNRKQKSPSLLQRLSGMVNWVSWNITNTATSRPTEMREFISHSYHNLQVGGGDANEDRKSDEVGEDTK